MKMVVDNGVNGRTEIGIDTAEDGLITEDCKAR